MRDSQRGYVGFDSCIPNMGNQTSSLLHAPHFDVPVKPHSDESPIKNDHLDLNPGILHWENKHLRCAAYAQENPH